MKLTTPVLIESANFNISHFDKMMLIGSCFAQNIGHQLNVLKFDTLINPFGIIYNPVSTADLLQRIIHLKKFTKKDILKNNEQYFSFEHHSLLNSLSASTHLTKINNLLAEANHFLKTSKILIFTFGTAYVYKHKSDNKIVANCHKVPNLNFEKMRLSVEDIFTNFNECLKQLFQFNNQLNVIFTVSPVRHIKDGITNNTKSKATLHLAIEQLIANNNKKCTYFPAYEIVVDELRDYRFYKSDLLHPTKLAIDYVWQQFRTAYFDKKTIELNAQITNLLKQFNHKPFNANTQSHKKSVEILLNKMEQFETANKISFKKEIEHLQKNINFVK